MARQADKSYYLKKLFEQQLVNTLPEAPHSVRQDQAAHLMDELVGPRWRTEVNKEMELIPDLEEMPSAQEVEEFWGGVQQAGYQAGFGTEEVTHDVPQDEDDHDCGCHTSQVPKSDPLIIVKIKQILGMK